MGVRLIVALLGLAAVCCTNGGAAPATSSALKTRVIAVVPGQIRALAQDGSRLAWMRPEWIGPDKRCEGRVEVFDLRKRQRTSLSRRCTDLEWAIAIGERRVVWEQVTGFGNTELDLRVVTAATDDRRSRTMAKLVMFNDEVDYAYPPPLVAGDGPTLVFYSLNGDVGCGSSGGFVRRIVGRKANRLFKASLPLALATAGGKVAVLEDLYPCPQNYDPRWSPDGTRIAWTRLGVMYVMNADGSAKRRVSPVGKAESPRWSPDGTKLAYGYARNRTKTPSQVQVVNADGSGDRRLATGRYPRWSPSGSSLSFVRGKDVWTVGSDGSAERRLTHDAVAHTGAAEWSPDGTRLVTLRANGLFVIRTDGTGQTRIGPGGTGPSVPQWSPTGAQIAFKNDGRVAVVNADGSNLRRFGQGENPAWSPDGRLIAFEDFNYVFVIPSAGGPKKEITPGWLRAGNPSWSPDGSTMVVGDSELSEPPTVRRKAGVYRVAPDGSGLRKLAPDDQTGVEIRDARTGARAGSFIVHGDADAMAFSGSFLTVLVGNKLQVFRPRTGSLVASVSVGPKRQGVTRELAVSAGGIVVFPVGRRIRDFDVQTRAVRTIAIARASPIGLSVEGRRVVWAENLGRRSVVKALVLPAR